MSTTLEFHCPTRIVHGLGSVTKLGSEVKVLGGQRAIIVTDAGIANAGLLEPLQASLDAAGVQHAVFAGVKHDAQVRSVDTAVQLCHEENIDVVVTIGGGSALVVGKAVAAIVTNSGSLGDLQGAANLEKPSLPTIAIPTTAGSGSEVSAAIPYYDEIRGRKTGTRSPHFFPEVAILDATLLETMPVRQGVLSGVDALTHAMEAYLTVRATPITDSLALAAIRLLTTSLRPAIFTKDLATKQQALLGSTMANMACGNAKLGLAHLLNRPVNTLFTAVPYGESIGILLVPVMAFNLPADVERFAQMATAMGETETGTTRQQAERCLAALKQLLVDLNATRCYPPNKVDRQAIPKMARMCAGGMHGGMEAVDVPETAVVSSFNRRRATVRDVMDLYEQAFAGWEM